MARRRPRTPAQSEIDELRDGIARLREIAPRLKNQAAKRTMEDVLALMDDLDKTRAALDPIKDPGAFFDPSMPETAGRLVALALIAQDRIPLSRIARTYGSGVYAIYYRGDHPLYAAISNSETPIYVGKADPSQPNAETPREQGPKLFNRLNDHRRMIETVSKYAESERLQHPLNLDDFEARRLVCATNMQYAAEQNLITMFKPIWNKEMGICWGISKHGDSASTRSNNRSPWDVVHPGRKWAMDKTLDDKMTAEEIADGIEAHFKKHPPYNDLAHIVRDFLSSFVQHAALKPDDVAERDTGD